MVSAAVDKYINSFIGIVVFAFLVGGTAALVLNSFTQISTSGVFLGSTIATLLGILFGVYILLTAKNMLKTGR